MQQKTTWMCFLIIGFSILFFTNSCTDHPGDVRNLTYIYTNNSSKNLIIEVFNTSSSTIESIEDFPLDTGESITLITDAAPFYSISGKLVTGDSISIHFDDNKCLSYSRDNTDGISYDEGTGLFNISNYDDYVPLIEINNKDFTLHYTITEAMYSTATPCP